MIPVIARKVGHSIASSIPKKYAGVEYLSYKTKNGSIISSSKIANPFESDITFQKDENSFWQQVAKEKLHWIYIKTFI